MKNKERIRACLLRLMVFMIVLSFVGLSKVPWAFASEFSEGGAPGETGISLAEAEVDFTEADFAERRVFDRAGLFSEKERLSFEEQMKSMRTEMNMDVVLVTTADAEGKTAEEYAEDFYIDGDFGTGKDYSGVLFLIDMDNRELYIVPVGNMNRFLTDQRWNDILDDAYEGASSGDYGACVLAYLTGVSKYYHEGIPGGQYNYDEQTGKISVYRSLTPWEVLLAFFGALLAAGLSCFGVAGRYAMKGGSGGRKAYQAGCRFECSNQADILVNKTVTHTTIPKNNGGGGGGGGGGSSGRSTVHTMSGRTMGGGGRKF